MYQDVNTNHWRPLASIEMLKARQAIISRIRDFFTSRDYLEVDTPVMAAFGVTDVYLESITVACLGKTYALQTSPEYHMKRLLAAGSGPIFQLGRAFRDDEVGRWHNPEFTMLEWYKPHMSMQEMLVEISAFFETVISEKPLKIVSYQAIFEQFCDVNPFDTTVSALSKVLAQYDLDNVLGKNESSLDAYLFLLMTHVIEPKLKQYDMPVAVIDFPVSQAALARIENHRAKRFEIYYHGIELANGFDELTDADEQLARFQRDIGIRKQKGLKAPEIDMRLIAALKSGIPNTTGVALGVDRLIALALKQDNIQAVLSFLD